MAQINVNNLTFAYEGSFDNVFENTSFSIDTNWRLGFVGRNGKGKTTFLNLLLGKYEYEGNISTNTIFDYFPYIVNSEELTKTAGELIESWKPGVEIWRVMCELPELSIDAELLYRPFGTLSFGERTKIMLAILFSGGNDFLLIDEPTNHLDKGKTENGWWLCLYGENIVAGLGVIDNDFHDRKDLTPNVCAVYTEEEHRKKGLAGKLLNKVVDDMANKGVATLYLVTDHIGFYERYGWEFVCMVQGDGEPEKTRMYIHR